MTTIIIISQTCTLTHIIIALAEFVSVYTLIILHTHLWRTGSLMSQVQQGVSIMNSNYSMRLDHGPCIHLWLISKEDGCGWFKLVRDFIIIAMYIE